MDWGLIAPAITGFVGAFAGAVLQPAVQHFLKRQERREDDSRTVGRQMRLMTEEIIADSRSLNRFAFDVSTQLTINSQPTFRTIYRDPRAVAAEYIDSKTQRPHAVWEPFRIHDQALRQLVQRLNALVQDGASRASDILVGNDPTKSIQDIVETEKERKELAESAIAAMDKAGWVRQQ